jgi:RNA polymerase sigma-70 factor (ECF subfamily)
MEEAARAELERSVREACDRRDYSEATAALVRGYGPEIFGFLVATNKSEHDASDIFSDFCLAALRGLPGFRFHSSLRTWAYTLARNAAHHHRRDTGRAARRRTGSSAIDEVAAAVRTSTLTFLRTERRTRLEELRDSLDPEDRELLVLRVDRGLSWDDVATAFNEGDAPLTPAERAKASQRLRKRFQVLKDSLREKARREGLA